MSLRWILSSVYINDQGCVIPVAADYASQWVCPRFPTGTESVLVRIDTEPQQLAAAAQDTRLTVCPPLGSLPAPDAVIAAYTSWGATAGMTMDALIYKLSETEPMFLSLD
jgi:hypothetical protein